MKTFRAFFFMFLLFNIVVVNAQTSDFFNYQTVVRDNVGDILANQNVSFRISILETTDTGASVYTEDHSTTTTNLGLVNFQIGNGAIVSGTFNTIDWSADLHFLQIELDATGGTAYQLIGTSQLISVPYALHAKTASNVSGLESIDEGNGIGLAIIGRNENNYGDIGIDAVDLSLNGSASTTTGATGAYSVAMGLGTTASGSRSITMGFATTASGISSIAMGSSTTASGNVSTAMGSNTTASGIASTAMGSNTTASGSFSTAMGSNTTASGNSSVAMGNDTKAESTNSTTIGRNNVGGGSGITWVETDPLFEIGNSTSSSAPTNALTVLKNGTITAPTFDISEITDDKALITKEYADANYNGSGLEALDEGNGIGWRLIGQNPLNYDDIGLNAIDLSDSDIAGAIIGASGNNSTAMGFNPAASGTYSTSMGFNTGASGSSSTSMGRFTMASGNSSTAMGFDTAASGTYSTVMGLSTKAEAFSGVAIGRYNIGGGDSGSWVSIDPLFEVGNGSDSFNRSNALTILKNGTITAPTFDISEITDDKALVTKEYVDANNTPTGLEKINEGNGFGLAIIGRNENNYDDIGLNAVDLSHSNGVSTTRGASGENSTAMGIYTTASGDNSSALGNGTTASGFSSTSMGLATIAESYGSTAIGSFNVGGGNPTNRVLTDPLFEIGNGEEFFSRSNALTVLNNGTITAPSFDIAEITDDKALITKEYLEANNSGSGLEAINEGNGFGLAIVGRDENNYGNIGLNAVDLSFSEFSSTTRGATGDNTFASGYNTTSSGKYATAIGSYTNAESFNSLAIGRFNVGGGDATSWVTSDPLFEIGNGSSSNRTNALTVLKNGRIGFRTATPNFNIHLKQTSNSQSGSGGIGFENDGDSDVWKIYHSGSHFSFAENGVRRAYITASTGAYMVTSDRRLKKNITEVESVLSKVNSLKVHRYLYKDQEVLAKETIGFMAQEIQQLFPELVEKAENGFLSLNYAGFSVIAIKAIQEQQNIIDAQQKTIDELLKRVTAIENKN